ncbi:MAG: gamma-glutamylcyclotransferase [Gammaproteobacteria bacterium]|nr:gamma-glutamylcyclotransferase [Gammaproteobacteria bacterium]MDH5735617.1 gamma-glutamylcyclotransferase [Gammaproteobacteria bacterium]
MNNIFVYGSLMFAPVWDRIIANHYQKCEAHLHGFKRLSIKNEVYPALVKAHEHSVSGVLIFDLRDSDLASLDQFEGDYYQRTPVQVEDKNGTLHLSDVYLFDQQYSHLLLDSEWDLNKFSQTGIDEFLSHYAGF